MILQLPSQLCPLVDTITALQSAFKIGLTVSSVALEALEVVEKWSTSPTSAQKQGLREVLPYLYSYLSKTETVQKVTNAQVRKSKTAYLVKEVSKEDVTYQDIQMKILGILGRIGSDSLYIQAFRKDPDLLVSYNPNSPITISIPFVDMSVDMNIGKLYFR